MYWSRIVLARTKRRLSIVQGLRLLIGVLLVGLGPVSLSAATIKTARDAQTHEVLLGVTVEGEIERGDTVKLLDELMTFDVTHDREVARLVFLRSKGGDVEEAMKMGTLIRRLRLVTQAPTKFDDKPILSEVLLTDKDNDICASACFLAYVGGVERDGNFLALHRPYVSKEAVGKLSDVEYEAAEKDIMTRVREYLRGMEIDQFFIDKVMSNSSQDSYVVTMTDTDTYHLDAIVPSMEEIVLAKCDDLTAQEKRISDSTSGATPEGRRVRARILAKMKTFHECKLKVLDDIRREAFKREMAALTASTESHKQEIDSLTVPGPKPPLTPAQALVRGLVQKGIEALATGDKAEASHWFHQAAEAGGVDVLKGIGRFYEGSDEMEAVRWYTEAADRGDSEAMSVLGRMYIWGLGKNCVTARYWYEKAVTAGDDDAKDFLQSGAFDELCPRPASRTPASSGANETPH